MKTIFLFICLLTFLFTSSRAQLAGSTENNSTDLNKPGRLEWFRSQGFGMFIHFGIDSQLGIVISHSMAGASEDYLSRFVNELPKTFTPDEFKPEEIARMAKLAGMKYIVFTTKHHSGFCMWDTETTSFNIMNTPYGKDILAQYVKAVRDAGLAVGFYYSPEDFHFLYENNVPIKRVFKKPLPSKLMNKYLSLCKKQCTELLQNYGPIDLIFFDGGQGPMLDLLEVCKKTAWKLQPNIVITRGAIKTPEQSLLGLASDIPWESCITMGTQWQYKPTNEDYKSAGRLIEILIETRAKGGNLLLNVGPKPNGSVPEKQKDNLMEMGAWNFINGEAVAGVVPWILTNEKNIWFTRKPDDKTVYAFLTRIPDWAYGARKEFVLKSVKAKKNTTISVLGQSGQRVEYHPQVDAKTYFKQKKDGLHISCVRAQRIYNDYGWRDPLVLRMHNVEPALDPPKVVTETPCLENGVLILRGKILSMGDASSLKAGFQYREYAGYTRQLYSDEWEETISVTISKTGAFKLQLPVEESGETYQIRAYAIHPKIQLPGNIVLKSY